MNSQKFIVGGIVGGILYFLLGYVILWHVAKKFL